MDEHINLNIDFTVDISKSTINVENALKQLRPALKSDIVVSIDQSSLSSIKKITDSLKTLNNFKLDDLGKSINAIDDKLHNLRSSIDLTNRSITSLGSNMASQSSRNLSDLDKLIGKLEQVRNIKKSMHTEIGNTGSNVGANQSVGVKINTKASTNSFNAAYDNFSRKFQGNMSELISGIELTDKLGKDINAFFQTASKKVQVRSGLGIQQTEKALAHEFGHAFLAGLPDKNKFLQEFSKEIESAKGNQKAIIDKTKNLYKDLSPIHQIEEVFVALLEKSYSNSGFRQTITGKVKNVYEKMFGDLNQQAAGLASRNSGGPAPRASTGIPTTIQGVASAQAGTKPVIFGKLNTKNFNEYVTQVGDYFYKLRFELDKNGKVINSYVADFGRDIKKVAGSIRLNNDALPLLDNALKRYLVDLGGQIDGTVNRVNETIKFLSRQVVDASGRVKTVYDVASIDANNKLKKLDTNKNKGYSNRGEAAVAAGLSEQEYSGVGIYNAQKLNQGLQSSNKLINSSAGLIQNKTIEQNTIDNFNKTIAAIDAEIKKLKELGDASGVAATQIAKLAATQSSLQKELSIRNREQKAGLFLGGLKEYGEKEGGYKELGKAATGVSRDRASNKLVETSTQVVQAGNQYLQVTKYLEKDEAGGSRVVDISTKALRNKAEALKQVALLSGGVSRGLLQMVETAAKVIVSYRLVTLAMQGVKEAFVQTVTQAGKVEQGQFDIIKILDQSNPAFATRKDREEAANKITEKSIQLSKLFGVATSDVLAVQRDFIALFGDTNDAVSATASALKLAVATGIDLKETSKALTSVGQQYQLTAKGVDQFVDSLNEVTNRLPTVNAQKLVENIQRVGSTAAEAGISLDKLTALVAVGIEKTGSAAAEVGNAFKSIFAGLQQKDKQGAVKDFLGLDDLSKFNYDEIFDKIRGKVKQNNLEIQKLNQSGQKEQADLLAGRQLQFFTKLGGAYQGNRAQAILGSSARFESIYDESTGRIKNAEGSAGREAAIALSSFEKTKDRFFASLNALATKAGFAILPTIKSILEAGINLFDTLEKSGDEFKSRFDDLKGAAATFGDLLKLVFNSVKPIIVPIFITLDGGVRIILKLIGAIGDLSRGFGKLVGWIPGVNELAQALTAVAIAGTAVSLSGTGGLIGGLVGGAAKGGVVGGVAAKGGALALGEAAGAAASGVALAAPVAAKAGQALQTAIKLEQAAEKTSKLSKLFQPIIGFVETLAARSGAAGVIGRLAQGVGGFLATLVAFAASPAGVVVLGLAGAAAVGESINNNTDGIKYKLSDSLNASIPGGQFVKYGLQKTLGFLGISDEQELGGANVFGGGKIANDSAKQTSVANINFAAVQARGQVEIQQKENDETIAKLRVSLDGNKDTGSESYKKDQKDLNKLTQTKTKLDSELKTVNKDLNRLGQDGVTSEELEEFTKKYSEFSGKLEGIVGGISGVKARKAEDEEAKARIIESTKNLKNKQAELAIAAAKREFDAIKQLREANEITTKQEIEKIGALLPKNLAILDQAKAKYQAEASKAQEKGKNSKDDEEKRLALEEEEAARAKVLDIEAEQNREIREDIGLQKQLRDETILLDGTRIKQQESLIGLLGDESSKAQLNLSYSKKNVDLEQRKLDSIIKQREDSLKLTNIAERHKAIEAFSQQIEEQKLGVIQSIVAVREKEKALIEQQFKILSEYLNISQSAATSPAAEAGVKALQAGVEVAKTEALIQKGIIQGEDARIARLSAAIKLRTAELDLAKQTAEQDLNRRLAGSSAAGQFGTTRGNIEKAQLTKEDSVRRIDSARQYSGDLFQYLNKNFSKDSLSALKGARSGADINESRISTQRDIVAKLIAKEGKGSDALNQISSIAGSATGDGSEAATKVFATAQGLSKPLTDSLNILGQMSIQYTLQKNIQQDTTNLVNATVDKELQQLEYRKLINDQAKQELDRQSKVLQARNSIVDSLKLSNDIEYKYQAAEEERLLNIKKIELDRKDLVDEIATKQRSAVGKTGTVKEEINNEVKRLQTQLGSRNAELAAERERKNQFELDKKLIPINEKRKEADRKEAEIGRQEQTGSQFGGVYTRASLFNQRNAVEKEKLKADIEEFNIVLEQQEIRKKTLEQKKNKNAGDVAELKSLNRTIDDGKKSVGEAQKNIKSINNRYNKDAEDAISLQFEERKSKLEDKKTILDAKQNLVSSDPLQGGTIGAATYESQKKEVDKDQLRLTILENKQKKELREDYIASKKLTAAQQEDALAEISKFNSEINSAAAQMTALSLSVDPLRKALQDVTDEINNKSFDNQSAYVDLLENRSKNDGTDNIVSTSRFAEQRRGIDEARLTTQYNRVQKQIAEGKANLAAKPGDLGIETELSKLHLEEQSIRIKIDGVRETVNPLRKALTDLSRDFGDNFKTAFGNALVALVKGPDLQKIQELSDKLIDLTNQAKDIDRKFVELDQQAADEIAPPSELLKRQRNLEKFAAERESQYAQKAKIEREKGEAQKALDDEKNPLSRLSKKFDKEYAEEQGKSLDNASKLFGDTLSGVLQTGNPLEAFSLAFAESKQGTPEEIFKDSTGVFEQTVKVDLPKALEEANRKVADLFKGLDGAASEGQISAANTQAEASIRFDGAVGNFEKIMSSLVGSTGGGTSIGSGGDGEDGSLDSALIVKRGDNLRDAENLQKLAIDSELKANHVQLDENSNVSTNAFKRLEVGNVTSDGGYHVDTANPDSLGRDSSTNFFYDRGTAAFIDKREGRSKPKELSLTGGNEPTFGDRFKSFFGGTPGTTQGGGSYVSEEQLRGPAFAKDKTRSSGGTDPYRTNTSPSGIQNEVAGSGGGAAAGAISGSGGGGSRGIQNEITNGVIVDSYGPPPPSGAPSAPSVPAKAGHAPLLSYQNIEAPKDKELGALRSRSDSRLGASISQDLVKGALGLGAGNEAAAAEGVLNAGAKFGLDQLAKGVAKNGLFGATVSAEMGEQIIGSATSQQGQLGGLFGSGISGFVRSSSGVNEQDRTAADKAGGSVGGTVVSVLGGAIGTLGGPIGTFIGSAIGGFIGDAVGGFVGDKFFGGGERDKKYGKEQEEARKKAEFDKQTAESQKKQMQNTIEYLGYQKEQAKWQKQAAEYSRINSREIQATGQSFKSAGELNNGADISVISQSALLSGRDFGALNNSSDLVKSYQDSATINNSGIANSFVGNESRNPTVSAFRSLDAVNGQTVKVNLVADSINVPDEARNITMNADINIPNIPEQTINLNPKVNNADLAKAVDVSGVNKIAQNSLDKTLDQQLKRYMV